MLWATSANLVGKILSTIAQLAVAAILADRDFGVYAQALFASAIITQALSPAIDQFLVSRAKDYSQYVASGFWLATLFGIVSFCLHCVLAPLIAWIQDARSLVYILPIMGVGSLLGTCLTTAMVRLSIEMRFREVAVVGLANALGIQSLTLIFALLGWGVYALIYPLLIINALTLAYYLIRLPIPGLLIPHFSQWPEIFRSSKQLIGVRTMQTLVGQGPYFILGLFAGDGVVGIYYIAFNLAAQVGRLLGASVSGVLTPALASIVGTDQKRAMNAVLESSRLLGVVVAPFSVCQIALAYSGVYALYGNKWMAAVPMIQIMLAVTLINVPAWPTGSLLTAAGRFRDLLWIWAVSTAIFAICGLAGTWLGALHSEVGAAIGLSIGVALFTLLSTGLAVVVTLGNSRLAIDMVAGLAKAVVACLPALACVISLQYMVQSSTRVEALVVCAVGSVLFAVLYVLCLRWIDIEGYRSAMQRLGLSRWLRKTA